MPGVLADCSVSASISLMMLAQIQVTGDTTSIYQHLTVTKSCKQVELLISFQMTNSGEFFHLLMENSSFKCLKMSPCPNLISVNGKIWTLSWGGGSWGSQELWSTEADCVFSCKFIIFADICDCEDNIRKLSKNSVIFFSVIHRAKGYVVKTCSQTLCCEKMCFCSWFFHRATKRLQTRKMWGI